MTASAPSLHGGPWPTLEQLLCLGGDARIALDPVTGLNAYGCPPLPRDEFPAYGSCTASILSAKGQAAARDLLERLLDGESAPGLAYGRLRATLSGLLGLDPGAKIVFAASGTDLHLLAAQAVAAAGPGALTVLMADASETGCGVPAALAGKHPGPRSALAGPVPVSSPLEMGAEPRLVELPLRSAEGLPRAAEELDAAFEAAASRAVDAGQRVLLVLSDLSKTGLLAPSPACALRLRQRFSGRLDVLVDACQLRLSPATLRAYLARGALVAITGSKFATGPAFCGALLLPAATAQAWAGQRLPASLAAYSARGDWPQGWTVRAALQAEANLGLLLRWEAALAEMRAFLALPEAAVAGFLADFAAAVQARLARPRALEALPAPAPGRGLGTDQGWDATPTIFPFLLKQGSDYLDGAGVDRVYQTLMSSHGQIGRPLRCGQRQGRPLAALRLCSSMRLVADALAPEGRGPQAVIAGALRLLDAAEAAAARA